MALTNLHKLEVIEGITGKMNAVLGNLREEIDKISKAGVSPEASKAENQNRTPTAGWFKSKQNVDRMKNEVDELKVFTEKMKDIEEMIKNTRDRKFFENTMSKSKKFYKHKSYVDAVDKLNLNFVRNFELKQKSEKLAEERRKMESKKPIIGLQDESSWLDRDTKEESKSQNQKGHPISCSPRISNSQKPKAPTAKQRVLSSAPNSPNLKMSVQKANVNKSARSQPSSPKAPQNKSNSNTDKAFRNFASKPNMQIKAITNQPSPIHAQKKSLTAIKTQIVERKNPPAQKKTQPIAIAQTDRSTKIMDEKKSIGIIKKSSQVSSTIIDSHGTRIPKNKPLYNKEYVNTILQRIHAKTSTDMVKPKPKVSETKISSDSEEKNSIQEFVNIVLKAKNERKTFTCCGCYPVRKSLVSRGWIEKIRVSVEDRENWRTLESLSYSALLEGMKIRENTFKYRRALLSKLLAGCQVDLYWDYGTNPFKINPDKVKLTLINRYPPGTMASFSNKASLCNSLNESNWYYIEGVSNIYYPRTYNLVTYEGLRGFIDDYQFTSATSLLQWIINAENENKTIISKTGTVPHCVFNFALVQCQQYIQFKQHHDIEENIWRAKDHEWNVFLDKYYRIIRNSEHFIDNDKLKQKEMVELSRQMLSRVEGSCPDLRIDGFHNVWILKPHCGSRGMGIMISKSLRIILEAIQNKPDQKYIIQKYIERPFLLYNTKFDIRQWFLVASMPYMTVWMYKECYLRFSSQPFDLNNLHESVHLTNNSIQCRYKNAKRDANLPEQNMWHCNTFKQYLVDHGSKSSWDNVYKQMKQAIISLFMICQERLSNRINSFELCGVDFMLTDDLRPYLIEVNTRPAIYASTKITAEMCPKVLEDVVKVVVDYNRNKKAQTGLFELIYTDNYKVNTNNEILSSLYIRGKSVSSKNKNRPNEEFKIDPTIHMEPKSEKEHKNTLEQMLAMIKSQQDRAHLEDIQEDMNMILNEIVRNATKGEKKK